MWILYDDAKNLILKISALFLFFSFGQRLGNTGTPLDFHLGAMVKATSHVLALGSHPGSFITPSFCFLFCELETMAGQREYKMTDHTWAAQHGSAQSSLQSSLRATLPCACANSACTPGMPPQLHRVCLLPGIQPGTRPLQSLMEGCSEI